MPKSTLESACQLGINATAQITAINSIPVKGLIADDLYIDKILAGTASWSIRSGNANQSEPIALIKQSSGQIVGVANLVATKASVSYQDRVNNLDQHLISEECLQSSRVDNWDIVWTLDNVQTLITAIRQLYPDWIDGLVDLETSVQKQLAIVCGISG